MSRAARRRAAPFALAVVALLAAPGALLSATQTPAGKSAPKKKEPVEQQARIKGEIVDCTDYMLRGKKGPDRRSIQAQDINQGMPACFVAEADGQVYLLISPSGHSKDAFQPTENFIGGATILEGTVYHRGSLKAFTINTITRTGSHGDRFSGRPNNPTPHKEVGEEKPPPKENP